MISKTSLFDLTRNDANAMDRKMRQEESALDKLKADAGIQFRNK